MKITNLNFSLLALFLFSLTAKAQINPERQASLFDNGMVHEIRLTINEKNWSDQLDSMRIYGEGMLICSATIDKNSYSNVGVGYRGSTSYQSGAKRNPFQLKLDYVDNTQTHNGVKSIKLSSALRDPSMVREMLGFEIANKYMIAPRASYTALYINEEFRGIYVNVEAVDDVFFQGRFGESGGESYKCFPDIKSKTPTGCNSNTFGSLKYEADQNCYQHNFTLQGSTSSWESVMDLSRMVTDNPSELHQMLNVDQALWMLAFNNVFVNLSSYTGQYSHNYYLYKDQNGKFNPIIWDLNLAWGSFKNTGYAITASVASDLDLKGLQTISPLLHSDNSDKPLIQGLLSVPQYKRIYLSHVRQLLFEVVLSGWYERRAQELQKQIAPLMEKDPFKFYTMQDFTSNLNSTVGAKSKIPGITELMNARGKYLKKFPELTPVPPVVGEISFAKREKFANVPVSAYEISIKADRFTKRVFVYWRVAGERQYYSYEINDEGRDGDKVAGDKVFGGTLPTSGAAKIEYYIMAENAALVGYEPSEYRNKFRTISLAELN